MLSTNKKRPESISSKIYVNVLISGRSMNLRPIGTVTLAVFMVTNVLQFLCFIPDDTTRYWPHTEELATVASAVYCSQHCVCGGGVVVCGGVWRGVEVV